VELLTQPASLSSLASRNTNGRNPTPCTAPRMAIRNREVCWELASLFCSTASAINSVLCDRPGKSRQPAPAIEAPHAAHRASVDKIEITAGGNIGSDGDPTSQISPGFDESDQPAISS